MQLPYESFIAALEKSAEELPFKMACNFFDDRNETQITYANLAERAKATAALMQEYTQVGDRVILIFPCSIDFVIAVFACWYAGVIAVPVYPPQTKELVSHLQKVIDDTKPTLCLSTKEICQKFIKMRMIKRFQHIGIVDKLIRKFSNEQLTKAMDLSAWDFEYLEWLAIDNIPTGYAKHFKYNIIQAHDIAMLQYTSGSTEQPKGVMLSHQNIMHNLQLNRIDGRVHENDCGLSWVPLYHNMGFLICVMQPLYSRIPANIMSPSAFLEQPIRWLKAITHYKASISGAPAFAYELCARHITDEEKKQLDLSSWKIAFCGGESVSISILDHFYQTFASCGFDRSAFYVAYGLTEATVYAAGSDRYEQIDELHIDKTALLANQIITYPTKNHDTQTLVGYRNNQHNMIIVDPNSLKSCQENEIGEIWINSLGVAPGYWQRPEETRATFKNYLDNGAGPFVRTGDLGFIHQDILYITGRLKELIIIRGKNYYPQDIEFHIHASHSLLNNSLVVAFSVLYDEVEKLVIVVELDGISEKDANNLFTAIRKAISIHYSLQVYAISIVASKTLKKTGLGKLRRPIICAEYVKGEISASFSWQCTLHHSMEKPLIPEKIKYMQETWLIQLQEANEILKQKLLKEYFQYLLSSILTAVHDKDIHDIEFFALGIDSLMLITLKNQLHELLSDHIKITTTLFFEYPTINKLATYLARELSSPSCFVHISHEHEKYHDIEEEIDEMDAAELIRKAESL